MLRKITSWLPALLWAAFIFYLSSKPGLRVAEGFWDFATRKPAHIFVYFVLYLLVARAFIRSNFTRKGDILVASFVLTLLYGVVDEFHQSFVPLREGKVLDIIWDGVGALLAAILWSFYQNPQNKPKNWLKNWLKK